MLDKAKQALSGKKNSLEPAKILDLDAKVEIPCQFNPKELSLSRSAHWYGMPTPFLNSPMMQYRGSSATTCQMALVFDTSETGDDVRVYTNQLIQLTMKGSGSHQKKDIFLSPPTVAFVWGKFKLFDAVITQLSISYVLFLGDGTPVRARASATFTQHDHEDDPLVSQNPTTRTDPRRTRISKMGERLDMIAYEEYGHPQHWRTLAQANDIDHVEALQAGQILIIPPLD